MSGFWKRSETELEREIAHHLHQLAAEYRRQGYSTADAARLAAKEFGGCDLVKERCRDERRWAWMTGFRQDLIFGLRMMRRTPIITAAAVLSLALGIGANTAIVSLMDVVLWRTLPVPHPKELRLIHWTGQGFPQELAESASGSMMREDGVDVADFFSNATFMELRKTAGARASVAAYGYPRQASVSFAGEPTVALARPISGNFLSTLEVRAELGRLLSDVDDNAAAPAAVVVSHHFWTRFLGSDTQVVGRTMVVDNVPCVIAGVLESGFYGMLPGDATEIYVPLRHAPAFSPQNSAYSSLDNNRHWVLSLLMRNHSGASMLPAMQGAFVRSWSAQPKNLAEAPHLRLDEGGRGLGILRQRFGSSLLVLGGLVGLLLLIACTNIANLLLARAVARRRELAMRISLGCSRARLARQFFTESALLAALGGAASIAVAWLTEQLLGQFLAGQESFPIAASLDIRTFAAIGAITTVALLVFGLFPAWNGSRQIGTSSLRQGAAISGESHRRWSAGRMFVVVQMAFSVVLVTAAVVFTRNLLSIQSADPGFDRRNLILFDIRPGTSGYDKTRLPEFYFNLERHLRSAPGVSAIGLAAMRPMNIGGWWESVRLAGQHESLNVSVNGVTAGYLPLFTSRRIVGRNIEPGDIGSAAKVVVISEDLARKLGGPGVLGRRLTMVGGPPGQKPPEYEIVGIAPAIAATSMKERPYVVWLPFNNEAWQATVVLRTSRPPMVVLPSIRQAMSDLDRNLPMVDAVTMEEQIAKGVQRERMFATLCNGFGILALALSVVGTYGVIAYNTSRRRAEIGVRLALGAMPRDVVSMVLGEGLRTTLLGVLMSAPLLWWGVKYLAKELPDLKTLEPVSVLTALGILLVAAVAAIGIPAVRASALDPADTLRQE